MDKYTVLKQYFGHSQFRAGQEPLIDAVLSGRDVLGVMPTGAGKSMCYQLPALLMPGISLVVSPLISLMKDQVAALGQAGVKAAYINSSLSAAQQQEAIRRARAGAYKLIYIAPERLLTDAFLRFATEAEISLLAVDEAHCVSQWGQDFRPSYLSIADFVASLPKRPVVGAFTATATSRVKEDIEALLGLREPLRITTGFDRPNLRFQVVRPKSKEAYLRAYIASRQGQSGIVYCSTRKTVESVCDSLRRGGVLAVRYHAGLSDDERRQNQEDFVYDRAQVMIATNAFGMGIDKSNVSFVAHYNMPKNIESYYQEAGRAGRDGAPADCTLLFAPGDVQTARYLIEHGEDNEALSDEERFAVRQQDLERLAKMAAYCKTTGCLRHYLLAYFGEASPEHCGNCGNCSGELTELDITAEAKKILSGVAEVEKRYRSGLGVTVLVRSLHGSREQRITQLGLDKLPSYGTLHHIDRPQIRACIDRLLEESYLLLDGQEYPVLRLTDKADAVLYHGQQVTLTQRKQSAPEPSRPTKKAAKAPPAADNDLLASLKQLRNKLAQKQNVPAYLVFSNAALADMAASQPSSIEEFLQVSGVGEVKARRYGKIFLAAIADFNGGCENEPGYMEQTEDAAHAAAYAPWTTEEDELLRREYSAGQTVAALSQSHTRSPGAISSRLKKLGLR